MNQTEQAGDPDWADEQDLVAARQEIAELRMRLAEEIERERILELEIAAVRKDIEVKQTYATALEETAEERKAYTQWLQAHFDLERSRAEAAEAELAAERSRLYYRLLRPVIRTVRRHPG